jgi:hypothetical protein
MKITTLVACLLCAPHLIYSQETLSASGGDATGSGGTVSYTVGQVFYTSLTGSTGTVSEGVQQPRGKTTYMYNGVWAPSDPSGAALASDAIEVTSGDVVINSNTAFNTFIVRPGAGVTVDSDVILTPIESLTLESTSTEFSSLILKGSILGTVNYERFVNELGTQSGGGNDLISVPLMPSSGMAFNEFIALGNPTNATKLATNNPSTVYAFAPYNNTSLAYENFTVSGTNTLPQGKGYRAATVTDLESFERNLTFTGEAETEDVTIAISTPINGSQWNLIGNPYPSYISSTAFLAANSGVLDPNPLDPAATAIYGYNSGTYEGNDLQIGNFTIINNNSNSALNIAPGQGFFVAATNTPGFSGTVTFKTTGTDMRTTTGIDDFILGRNSDTNYNLKLNLTNTNKSYSTSFYFNANSSLGLDAGYDAAVFGANAPSFAIFSHLIEENIGRDFAIQSLPVLDNINDIVVPLGVNANQGEQITFSILESSLPAAVTIYLEDTVTNTVTLLNNSDYIITPTTALSGTGRFFLRTSDAALSTIDNTLDALTIFVLNSSKELIVSGQLQDATTLELFDTQGRKVLSTVLDASRLENRINTASLSTGVYVTKVFNHSQTKTKKVIIK